MKIKSKLYKKILSTSATVVLSHIRDTNEDLEITTDDGKKYVISAKRVMRSRDDTTR